MKIDRNLVRTVPALWGYGKSRDHHAARVGHAFLMASLLICRLSLGLGGKARKRRGASGQPRAGQVSTFPCPRQQTQHHLKPAQAGVREDMAQGARQQGGRGTHRLLTPGRVILGTEQH